MKCDRYMLLLLSALSLPFAALAADPPAAPAEQPRGAQGRPASPMFEQLDGDKDGFVSAKEVEKSATAKANFKTLDTDGDGKLSPQEWSALEGK